MFQLDSLQLNATVFKDFNDELSEEVSLKFDQAFLVQMFPATTVQEILLLPLIEVDLNVGREQVGEDLTALVDAEK